MPTQPLAKKISLQTSDIDAACYAVAASRAYAGKTLEKHFIQYAKIRLSRIRLKPLEALRRSLTLICLLFQIAPNFYPKQTKPE